MSFDSVAIKTRGSPRGKGLCPAVCGRLPTAQHPFEKGCAAGLTLNLILGSAQTRTRRVAGGKGCLPFPLRGSVSLRSVKGRVVFSDENLHP